METNIGWTDWTWNPYTWDCTRISPGCKNCYMMSMAEKFKRPQTGAPNLREKAWKELRKALPGTVLFVNSMSDTYHQSVPGEWIHRIHNTAIAHPDLTFLVLTKRIERAYHMRQVLAWPDNLWIGTSVENADYLWRLDYLRQIPAAGRFVSFEPLLGPVDDANLTNVNWCIVGGESGTGRRLFLKTWAVSLRDKCKVSGIPFFFKQGSARLPGRDHDLEGAIVQEVPPEFAARKVAA